MNAPPLIDPKCYDLAEYFLPSEALSTEIYALGGLIQEAVEDYLRERDRPAEVAA